LGSNVNRTRRRGRGKASGAKDLGEKKGGTGSGANSGLASRTAKDVNDRLYFNGMKKKVMTDGKLIEDLRARTNTDHGVKKKGKTQTFDRIGRWQRRDGGRNEKTKTDAMTRNLKLLHSEKSLARGHRSKDGNPWWSRSV